MPPRRGTPERSEPPRRMACGERSQLRSSVARPMLPSRATIAAKRPPSASWASKARTKLSPLRERRGDQFHSAVQPHVQMAYSQRQAGAGRHPDSRPQLQFAMLELILCVDQPAPSFDDAFAALFLRSSRRRLWGGGAAGKESRLVLDQPTSVASSVSASSSGVSASSATVRSAGWSSPLSAGGGVVDA